MNRTINLLVLIIFIFSVSCKNGNPEINMISEDSLNYLKKLYIDSFAYGPKSHLNFKYLTDYYFDHSISVYDCDTIDKIVISSFLFALDEKSLQKRKVNENDTIYRLLWTPSFHNPLVIKVKKENNKHYLFGKISDGKSGYYTGLTKTEIKKEIPDSIWIKLNNYLSHCNFWNMKSRVEDDGFDGAGWFFEVKMKNRYHYIYRRSPNHGKDSLSKEFSKIGFLLIDNLETTIKEKK
jgi:hypothetical protein